MSQRREVFRVAQPKKGERKSATNMVVLLSDRTFRPKAPILLGTNCFYAHNKELIAGEWANLTPGQAERIGKRLVEWAKLARRKQL